MADPKPPAKKGLAKRLERYPSTATQELATLETELGGRQQLVGMLVLAPLNPDLRYLLGLLGDPRHQGKSLAEICALGNILPGELLKHLASAALLKGKVQASQHIGNGIGKVAEDIMRRAAPYEDACHACLGLGRTTPEPTKQQPNPSPQPCETCTGTGKLSYRPDLERQRLAVDLANLLPKAGGIQIGVQQVNGGGGWSGGGGGGGPLEKLQQLTDRWLYGSGIPGEEPPSTVEGEIVPGAEGQGESPAE